MDLLPE